MRGFEPLTPWLQTRCSAELSYIPEARHDTAATCSVTHHHRLIDLERAHEKAALSISPTIASMS